MTKKLAYDNKNDKLMKRVSDKNTPDYGLVKKNTAQQFTSKNWNKTKFFLPKQSFWAVNYTYIFQNETLVSTVIFNHSTVLVFNTDFCLKVTRHKGNYYLFF